MVEAIWTGQESRATDGDVQNVVRQIVASRLPQILAGADDVQLQEFLELALGQLRAARSVSYEACRLMLASQLDISKTLPAEHIERELRWLSNLLQNPPTPQRATDPEQLEAILVQVFGTMSEVHTAAIANMTDAKEVEPTVLCDANIALYEAIAMLPQRERAIALRGMFQAEE